jgi:lipoprotein-releasing system permease protein
LNNISLLLALRYLFASAYQQTLSTMSIICFVGIAVGTFSLSLVMAIMQGFETTISKKMQGIHAQATIQSHGNPIQVDAVKGLILNEFPEIKAVSPYSIAYAIIQPHDKDSSPSIVMLKGIDPLQEKAVSTIEQKLVHRAHFENLIHDNHIVIGKGLANNLGIYLHDTIPLYYLDQLEGKKKVQIHKTDAYVSGIFSTGIDEFDSSLVYCSQNFIEHHFPESTINHVNISFHTLTDEYTTITRLSQRLGLDVYSWKDLYPALVSALRLEKYAMFFVLLLITLVASMSIVSLLYMLIQQKRADIAILRAMGMPMKSITYIFVYIGIIISFTASCLGLSLSLLGAYILQNYPFIELPDAYYVSHLPAQMEWHIILLVFTSVMVLGLLATWIAARSTQYIQIAHVLRFE